MYLNPLPLESIDRAAMVMARHLGFVMCERVRLFGFPFHETLTLLRSSDGIVHLVEASFVENNTGGGNVKPCHLLTIFEDGSRVITSKVSSGSFDGQTRILVATGDLERDLREHMLVVSAFAKDREVAIVPDMSFEHLLHLYDDLRGHTKLHHRAMLTVFTGGFVLIWGLTVFMMAYLATLFQRIPAPTHTSSTLLEADEDAEGDAAEVVFSLEGPADSAHEDAQAQVVLDEVSHN